MMASSPRSPSGRRGGPAWLVDDIYPDPSATSTGLADPAGRTAPVPGAETDGLSAAIDALHASKSYDEAVETLGYNLLFLGVQDRLALQRAFDAWVGQDRWQPLKDVIDSTHFPRDEDVRRVPALSRRIDAMRDSLPYGQLVHGRRIYGVPGDRSLPVYMTPMVDGAATFTNFDRYFHEYWAGQLPLSADQTDQAIAYAVATPSDGPDNDPATTGGTKNDVGVTGIPWMRRNGTDLEFFPEENWVRSFLVESYDRDRYPDVVVNQTEAGQHSAAPGLVMHGISYDEHGNPILVAYGMGTTPWMDGLRPIWHNFVNKYWSEHHRRILEPMLGHEEEEPPWPWPW